VLWRLRGDLRWATRVAGGVSRVLGVVMIAAGLVTLLTYTAGGLWLALIGWFVMAAGTAEARVVEEREALAGLSVRDAMVRDPITVSSNATLQDAFDHVLSEHRHAVYPVVGNGAVTGLLAARDLAAVPRTRWQNVLVRARTLPLRQMVVVDEREDLAEALTRLIETDLRCALVLRDSQLAGLLSLSDVERLAATRAGAPAGVVPTR
jgi:CBS domain-containing protein